MNKLKNYIAQYISLNNKIKEKQNELYELKDKKENLNEIIIHLIDENNLQDNIFKFKENKIQKKDVVQYQALSLKYIQNCIENYMSNNNSICLEDIMELIKQNRNKKIKSEIKIF
jgi:hypothetical protein